MRTISGGGGGGGDKIGRSTPTRPRRHLPRQLRTPLISCRVCTMCPLASFITNQPKLSTPPLIVLFSSLLFTSSHTTRKTNMFGQHGNQTYLDRVLSHYDQFPSLHTTAAAEPVFQILAVQGNEYDSVFGELGHSSSGCSSYVDSPSSNCTQSPSLTQRSISCHSLITTNSDAYYNIEPEKSHDSHQVILINL